jgi:hypothetical protein
MKTCVFQEGDGEGTLCGLTGGVTNLKYVLRRCEPQICPFFQTWKQSSSISKEQEAEK